MTKLLKKIKLKLWRLFYLPSINRAYVRQLAVFESAQAPDPEKLFIITTAFNDVDLIVLQHAALKKFLVTPNEYFVIDNSTRDDGVEKIKKYCLENNINYLRVPPNPGQGRDAGTPHGLALNWAYRNVVVKYKPKTFGIWDGDLFPTKLVDVGAKLEQADAWGIAIKLRPSLKPWHYPAYLWVGLSCFRVAWFKGRTPNFLPDFGVDTGGRIPLDEHIMRTFPDMPDFYASPFVDVAPGARMRKCGDFVHFESSSLGYQGLQSAEADRLLAKALVEKKHWIELLLEDKAPAPTPVQ